MKRAIALIAAGILTISCAERPMLQQEARCESTNESQMQSGILTEIITCDFTEPFFSMTFDLKNRQMIYSGYDLETDDEVRKVIETGIQVIPTSEDLLLPTVEIRSSEGKLLAVIKLDVAGSNGMTDTVYPFSIELAGFGGNPINESGGCISDRLGAVEPYSN
jgi:hypothetical protein